MASTSKCTYCGSTMSSDDERCPGCGAPNPNYVADTPRTVFFPKTIDELKEYCAERGMPLLRMRFFIGEDYREPKAFGIYQSGEDFVVYKNKADGTRAIRYCGPDEAYAVGELFAKLLEECHNRGIYPDGKVPTRSRARSNDEITKRIFAFIFAFFFFFPMLYGAVFNIFHKNDGYYSNGNGLVYYHYGNDWYYTHDTNSAGYWYKADSFEVEDYDEYYIGSDFNSDWGVSNFKNSSTWNEIHETHSSGSSDYSSWDSGGTDWDSDW